MSEKSILYGATINSLSIETESKPERQKICCDVLILGAGPAGLTAAIYTSRAKLDTIILDKSMTGGQVSKTYTIANYPGTIIDISGIDLMQNMEAQALNFGAKIHDFKEVQEIHLQGETKHIITSDAEYIAKAVILSTGAEPRKLPAIGAEEFIGRGVHYCATCDGALYADAEILVVGGGNSAVEEAEYLTRFAKKVTIVHRSGKLRAFQAEQDKIKQNSKIEFMLDSVIKEVTGDAFVKSVVIENLKTGEVTERETAGLFIYIGMEPRTEKLQAELKLTEAGYILTGENMETNIPGVFAAGDVREKKVRQIATAVGDGAIAGVMVEKYINGGLM